MTRVLEMYSVFAIPGMKVNARTVLAIAAPGIRRRVRSLTIRDPLEGLLHLHVATTMRDDASH